ncbi:hypothetical protein BH10PSE15_BH10PSE15_10280 [soil metagenome]
MAADKMDIDLSSVLDNVEDKVVEFTDEVDGDDYEFAVQYAVIEALSGDAPEDDAVDMFTRFSDTIAEAGLFALARDSDAVPIVISENDLE